MDRLIINLDSGAFSNTELYSTVTIDGARAWILLFKSQLPVNALLSKGLSAFDDSTEMYIYYGGFMYKIMDTLYNRSLINYDSSAFSGLLLESVTEEDEILYWFTKKDCIGKTRVVYKKVSDKEVLEVNYCVVGYDTRGNSLYFLKTIQLLRADTEFSIDFLFKRED